MLGTGEGVRAADEAEELIEAGESERRNERGSWTMSNFVSEATGAAGFEEAVSVTIGDEGV